MDKLTDIEFCIICCVILKPKLMKEVKFKSEYMVKHRYLWDFLKTFYDNFEDFDIQLIYSMYPHPKEFETFIKEVSETYVNISNFDLYQQELIRTREETQKDKFIIENVYDLAVRLQCRMLTVNEFKDKWEYVYKIANEKYKDISNTHVDPSKMHEI